MALATYVVELAHREPEHAHLVRVIEGSFGAEAGPVAVADVALLAAAAVQRLAELEQVPFDVALGELAPTVK